jgi:multidrug efflux system membrane fusion protein
VLPTDLQQQHPRGRLIFVDNAVDPSTGTIRLRAQFDNVEAALWPGQFVSISLQLYEQPDALIVPSQAVQTGPEGEYVYVINAEMVAELRRVKVQRTDGDYSIIAQGVAKGEQVVTRGQLRLGPKVKVQIAKSAEAS